MRVSSAFWAARNAPRSAASTYGVVIAKTHGNVPAPTVSAMNHAWSTVSSTAFGLMVIYVADPPARVCDRPQAMPSMGLAAPFGAFGRVAGPHRSGVVLVGARHCAIGQHQLLHRLVPLGLPRLITH